MRHQYFHLTVFTVYIVLVTFLMIYLGIGVTLDRYAFVLLAGAFLIHHNKKFIHDFMPFILILISYDFLRGIADDVNKNIHFMEPIRVTEWVFNGHLPTIELQKRFYTPGVLHWYDYGAAFLYAIHFAVPLLFAFYLWIKNKKFFREYMLGLVVLSYAGFLSYITFPSAPPWLASANGYVPHITKIFNVVTAQFPQRINIPTIYSLFSYNLVAALPSMHASYPFITFLFATRYFKAWGFLLLAYVLAMWLTIVYLGEHYFIDVVVGVIYCLIVFAVTKPLFNKYHKFLDKL